MNDSVSNLLNISGDYISRGVVLYDHFDETITTAIDVVLQNAFHHIKDVYPEAYELLHDMWMADKCGV